jgi:type II secretory pathway predicted ATPase ExeA
MKMLRLKYTVAKMQGVATVDGQVVAEATLMCKLILADKPADSSDKSGQPVEAPAP